MFLVDTNVWIERLLDQEHSTEVGRFLDAVPSDVLYITDLALHSICLVMCRLGQQEGLLRFDRTPRGRRTPGQVLEG